VKRALVGTLFVAAARCVVASTGDWPVYGGDPGGSRFTPLTEITPHNVTKLQIAWQFRTGDLVANAGLQTMKLPAFEATAIAVDDTLFLCTPRNQVIALDPQRGTERWRYRHDPQYEGHYVMTCRGVSHYRDPAARNDALCASRILTGTVDGFLVALDARSGEPCPDFGRDGRIDLRDGLGKIEPGHYKVMSPPVVAGDNVVVGALVEDNQRLDSPPGVVRAYDARSGRLVWAWDPVPPGWRNDSDGRWQKGTPNAWSLFSADPARDLLFVPTGNAAPDFYSGERRGLDHFSSSVVALRASTGELVWQFQTVHHDVWDYDVASQPVLFDFPGPDGDVPALVQATKQGYLFFLNRETGQPLFPVNERPVPGSDVPGMVVSPTQPVPAKPEPLVPQRLTVDDMWGFTPWDRAACRREFLRYRSEGIYTPPSEQGTIMYPSNLGASNWGSVSVDPVRGLLIANYNRMASVLRLIPRTEADRMIAEGRPPVYPVADSRYAYDQFNLLSPFGAPCNRPPWGALRAIDLASGRTVWDVPLGTTRDMAPFPFWFSLGVPNQGGSLLTASGLVFIGATTDDYLRAFDSRSGEELWKHRLPAGGQATPMSYRGADGRQYIVIAAGGHAYLGTTLGDSVVAFALP